LAVKIRARHRDSLRPRPAIDRFGRKCDEFAGAQAPRRVCYRGASVAAIRPLIAPPATLGLAPFLRTVREGNC
jgi:hypothetical protein